jgi:hypothetical protein
LQTVDVDAKKSAECIPLDEASLKIYDNMIKVRSRHGFLTAPAAGLRGTPASRARRLFCPPPCTPRIAPPPRGIAPLRTCLCR